MSDEADSSTQAALLVRALRHTRDAVVITDADLGPHGPTIVYANPAMAAQTGFDIDEIIGETPRMFQGPDTDRSELDRIRAALERQEPIRAELVNYAKDGREYVVELDIAPLGEGGDAEHFVSVQRDVTDVRAAENMLARSHDFHLRLAGLVREALDQHIDASYLSRILDQAVDVVPGAQAGTLKLIDEDDDVVRFVAVRGFDDALMDVTFPAEYILRDFPGRMAVVKKGFSPPSDMDPDTVRALYGSVGRASDIRASLGISLWVGGRLRGLLNLDNFESEEAFSEISESIGLLYGRLLEQADQQIDVSRQLRTDAVTGLPVRSYGEAMLARLLDQLEDRAGAFLLLDLDDFKMINDAYGHHVGDLVMRQMGERVRAAVGAYGNVTRWSGDEFMILLHDVSQHRPIAAVAQAVLTAVERPVGVGEHELSMSGSLGVVELPDHARDASEAIQHALIAVHRAKESARGAYVVYRPEMRDMVTRRVRLERELRTALQDDAIHLHFQPRFDLSTGRIVAVEALARWDHEELGSVPPDEFIAVAEDTGLIHALGERTLSVACRQARTWLDAGTPVRVGVNVSAKELQGDRFPHLVERTLTEVELPASLLEIEITESTAMNDVHATIEILKALRNLGVLVSIDDFGTAYSSLNYLQRLPVVALKIDRSFVRELSDDVSDDADETALVRGIVALATTMRLKVVAEGVETPAQLAYLTHLECDEAQGYYLGKPVAACDLDLDRTL